MLYKIEQDGPRLLSQNWLHGADGRAQDLTLARFDHDSKEVRQDKTRDMLHYVGFKELDDSFYEASNLKTGSNLKSQQSLGSRSVGLH